MIKHQLLITARQRPEILERILRVVRHRGFRVSMINMEALYNDKIQLFLTVTSERPLHLLTTQLDKLMDVDQVDIQLEAKQLRA